MAHDTVSGLIGVFTSVKVVKIEDQVGVASVMVTKTLGIRGIA